MEVKLSAFAVDVLTSHYRVYGEIRTIGDPTNYLNDPDVDTLIIHDASLLPLRQGMRLEALFMDELYIPKSEPQLITLGDYKPQATLLPVEEKLICFTDTYLFRGSFHMGAETRLHDVFMSRSGPFFLATDVDVFTVYQFKTEVKVFSTLAYIRGDAVRAFYRADSQNLAEGAV